MKTTANSNENGICLPGEEVWEMWRAGSGGWSRSQAAPADQNSPAAFKGASIFGFPVSSAFAVPLRAATTDPELLPDLVGVQLERQGIPPHVPAGKLNDFRIVERMESQTLILANVLNPQLADDLPASAPGQFEISPYLYYLPDNALVIWRELGRLVFCVSHGDQPIYYHALSESTLSEHTASEIEHLLMPLYTQGLLGHLETVQLWTRAVAPGGPEALANVFGVPVHQVPMPPPAPPAQASLLEPVSVAEGKIRAARIARVRNIATVCVLAWLAIPAFFAVRWFMANENMKRLKNEVAAMQSKYGGVQQTIETVDKMQNAINFDKYPIELLKQVLDPLYVGKPEVRLNSVEIERGDESQITIKGSSKTTQQAIAYNTKVKLNPLLKDYVWTPKTESQKDQEVGFSITGTTKKENTDGTVK